jgi:hypothetical protein
MRQGRRLRPGTPATAAGFTMTQSVDNAASRQLPCIDAVMTGLRNCKSHLICLDGGVAHQAKVSFVH